MAVDSGQLVEAGPAQGGVGGVEGLQPGEAAQLPVVRLVNSRLEMRSEADNMLPAFLGHKDTAQYLSLCLHGVTERIYSQNAIKAQRKVIEGFI